MIKKIKNELDNYLEFDSDKLFKNTDYLVVFGGALRDIVADNADTIKDVDIMCLSKSKRTVTNVLLSQGYEKYDLFSPDIYLLYANIKCIFEPKTFIKGTKIVQLITPNPRQFKKDNQEEILKESFFHLLSNVDLSSSGILYDGENLYESVKCSVELCKLKKYFVLHDSEMYNKDRIIVRENSLLKKGWVEIKLLGDLIMQRFLKIQSLKNNYPSIEDLKRKLQ